MDTGGGGDASEIEVLQALESLMNIGEDWIPTPGFSDFFKFHGAALRAIADKRQTIKDEIAKKNVEQLLLGQRPNYPDQPFGLGWAYKYGRDECD